MQKLRDLFTWLKGLFLHPKEENTDMSEALNTTGTAVASNPVQQETALNDTQQVAQVAQGADDSLKSPAATAIDNFLSTKGVNDFEAALAFVESGVAQLGEAAKDELKALAKKYL